MTTDDRSRHPSPPEASTSDPSGPSEAPAPDTSAAPQQGADETPREHTSPSRSSPSPSAGRPAPRQQKKSFLRELPGIVITALVISVLIKTFLVQAFYIPSGSMVNTLLVNDRVLVNKLVDKPDEVRRGDVVVFRDPGGWLGGGQSQGRGGVLGAVRDGLVFVGLAPAVGEEDLIKRVIGVGGDVVECCSDTQRRLTVNGVQLDEPYLFPGDDPSTVDFEETVPEGKLWVMGDHRSVSEDSRAHRGQPGKGFVPVDDVIGRAFTVVWPLDRARILRRSGTLGTTAVEESSR
jgi:signal peptidase I